MPASELTVVCADGDATDRTAATDALAAAGVDVRGVDSIAAVEAALDPTVDCVVTGFELEDGDAFELVEAVRRSTPDVAVILFTDVAPTELPRPSDPELVVEYVGKGTPGAHERLVSLVTQAATPSYQVAYPVPADEADRIAALRRYDVAANAAADTFERLTDLVVSHFDIDVAFVGLVDEHEERFVACTGADWETLDREDTICTHTILDEETMVVEDVQADPRFASNDTLAELNIRSYAGVRLTTPEGHALGALCCIDDEPRSYTSSELADLELFAAEVEEQLLLRRRLQDQPESSG